MIPAFSISAISLAISASSQPKSTDNSPKSALLFGDCVFCFLNLRNDTFQFHHRKISLLFRFFVCLQLKLIISRTIFTIMFDKMPFDFIRHKSKAALKRTHSKILVASRYTFQKQPRIIKHNCLFRTVFIKPFVTFLSKQLLSFLIVNYQSFLQLYQL